MGTDEIIRARFEGLEAQGKALPPDTNNSGVSAYRAGAWQQWATSAQHLLVNVFGRDSSHATAFERIYSKLETGYVRDVQALQGIFRAAMSDYNAGLAFSLQARISGEIYGDFVGLAKQALADGSKDVAAVLACAALEDALKRLAAAHGLDVSDKVMQEVVNALKGKGLVQGAQKALLDTMPKIRDYAMHAQWEKIGEQDVGGVIGYVEHLLLKEFS